MKGVTIHDIGGQRFLFHFFHSGDLKRVLDGGPWSFENNLLVLSPVQSGVKPVDIPLAYVNFLVYVYDLPTRFFSHRIGQLLGNFIGSFVEYDKNNGVMVWKDFLRLKVRLNVHLPLKRFKVIKKPDGAVLLLFSSIRGCLHSVSLVVC